MLHPTGQRVLEQPWHGVKVLFLMDNAGDNLVDLFYDNIHIKFFSPNTTSHIQPMDQAVICAFKTPSSNLLEK